MPKVASAPPVLTAATVAAALRTLPRYYKTQDLEGALGSRDALVDAYVQGWLDPVALDVLEQLDPGRLQCWLIARLIRLRLESA